MKQITGLTSERDAGLSSRRSDSFAFGEVPVNAPDKQSQPLPRDLEEVRFTLRAPQYVFGQIDSARKTRVGFVSRNTWILEAITEKLQRELSGRSP